MANEIVGGATAVAPADPAPRRRSRWQSPVVRRLLRHRMFVSGAILLLIVGLAAIFADLLAPSDPLKISIRTRFEPPGAEWLFGTDNFGRSQWSRVLYGARLSLMIGLGVVILNAVFGTLVGALAGYFRSLDNLLMRITDAFMAFPVILLAIGITAALGPGSLNAVIALAAVYTPRTARIVRASVLVVREMEYVEAARAMGATHWRIIWHHILPNCMAPLIVQLTFIFAYSVLSEAVLSFLGLGAQPPTPTWGNIIAEGRQYIREAPWITAIPGIALAMTVMGLNLLGDGLRDVLDPRLKVQQG
ncbi:ABC transporter permease [Marinimicrococcus flavescens]|uniref:ABC transporter permease n=1 Tax=Marinimicrococcus flavescens TaxID=3031815 RepID=A0AAP3XSQ4_9PROT|nr:ABC transporter permease [Marinimicrococcus flavescens]